jgi:D-alanyl-D-alanine carboxypeptidase
MKLRIYLLLASIVCLNLNLSIALPKTALVDETQLSQAQLQQTLDDRVKGLMQRQHIPGMAVAVMRDEKAEIKGYGVTDIDTKQPVDANTAFAIGSITKPFTAMAVMMLVEEGKVDLEKPISQYLPDLPSSWRPLNLRQLLSHTAGISEKGYWRKRKSPQDLLRVVNSELDFPPGESWMYSNTGFFLAGLVIEKVSGKPYGEFLRDRIFIPLDMKQTQATLATVPNLAIGYAWNNRLKRLDATLKDPQSFASGNIISTTNDMVKWMQALDQGKLLSTSSYQQLWTATPLKNRRSTPYGLGWFVENFNGHPSTHHGGNSALHSSGLVRYPKDRLNVLILSNIRDINGTKIANSIASVYIPTVSLLTFRPQPDPDPKFTQRFLSLIQGDSEILPFAPEFKLQLKTNRYKALWPEEKKKLREVQKLDFLHMETNNGDRSYYYKTFLKGKTTYIRVDMTAQQQIAGYGSAEEP